MDKAYSLQYSELEKTHWWFLARAEIISAVLKKFMPQQPISILNIGVAGGESSQWLSHFGKVTSVENDSFFIEHLKNSGKDIVEGSITRLPFVDSSFDLVCAFDVVEHVEDDKKAMAEMKRVCREDGFICITVPADRKLWSGHDVVNQHFRRYQITDFCMLGSGMKSIYISYFNSFLYIPIWIARTWPYRNRISPQSDFETFKASSLSNRILKHIFSFEARLMPTIKFPFGVSLIGLWKVSRKL